MTDRQLPKWSELKPLLRPKPIETNPTERRLAKALTIADLRAIAKRRTPRSVFDYTDGAAEAEISLRRARELFAEMELQPSILRDVSDIDLGTSILGGRSAQPRQPPRSKWCPWSTAHTGCRGFRRPARPRSRPRGSSSG